MLTPAQALMNENLREYDFRFEVGNSTFHFSGLLFFYCLLPVFGSQSFDVDYFLSSLPLCLFTQVSLKV